MPPFKSAGTTASERYLAQLCERTFLTLWSYPNVFRDQCQKAGKGDGKELCDLLVVFGDDVIIFSDKSCGFPDTGNPHVDWSRWCKRSILKASDQLYGAERWLRQFPDRVYLDSKCTQRFPFPITNPAKVRFHRIVVALNAAERCRRAIGGSGSLILMPHLVGTAHIDPTDTNFTPFAIGQINPSRGFVHVFDDITLDTVVRELDTVSDFIKYLRKKEVLITRGRLYAAPGEEDLLAVYLTQMDESGTHGFEGDDRTRLLVDENSWEYLSSNARYVAKKYADQSSYVWDRIIEEFTKHTLGGTLVLGSNAAITENEKAYRILASESRLARRVLSNALGEKVRSTPSGKISIRTVVSQEHRETIYVFVVMSNPSGDEERYRDYRRAYLSDYCFVVAEKYRHFTRVVGLATESGIEGGRSHDLVLVEPDRWTDEMVAHAQRIQKERGFHTRLTYSSSQDEEYPKALPVRFLQRLHGRKRIGRNEQCLCGSGRKYKKCCLRR